MRRFIVIPAALSFLALLLSALLCAPWCTSSAWAAASTHSVDEARKAKAIFDRLQGGQGHAARVAQGAEPYVLAPGQIINFDYKGYCMDVDLPAPKKDEALAFRPITNFVAPSLVELYRQVMRLDGAGQSGGADVQNIVWGFRAEKAKAGNKERALLDRAKPGGANLYATASRGRFVSGDKPGASAPRQNRNNQDLARLFGQMLRGGDFSRPSQDLMRALNDMGVDSPIPKPEMRYSLLTTDVAGYGLGKGGLTIRGMVANGSDAPYVFDPTLWALESQRAVQRVALPLFREAKLNTPPAAEQSRAQDPQPGQPDGKADAKPSADGQPGSPGQKGGASSGGEAYEFQMRPSPQ